jgi:DNA-directed RNA polymerase specialized sigma24 family protein
VADCVNAVIKPMESEKLPECGPSNAILRTRSTLTLSRPRSLSLAELLPSTPMPFKFVEQNETHRRLKGIVARISRDPSWHDDLIQEAKIHLWQMEQRASGHTQSWYLQSCYFHLSKLVKAGKSLDSTKRSARRMVLSDSAEEDECAALSETFIEESISETVCVRDFQSQLLQRLKPLDGRVLLLLLEGDSLSEIARQLHVSHTCVAKHRRTIMLEAIKLGLVPSRA